MKNNRRHLAIVSVLVVIGTVVTYYLLTAIYKLPTAASRQAGPIDTMFNAHFLAISVLFALIVVFILYSVVVFRRQPGDEEDGTHFHGNTALEIIWTIIPLVTVIAFGIWAAFVLREVTAEGPDELAVQVTGRQWSWAFSYPDYEEVGVTNELVLPIDRQVRLEMTSDDVIHSFWVPEFRVKQDLLPGQLVVLRVTPNLVGDYKLRCAEMCGFDHANMITNVRVVSQADFDQWVADQSVSIANLSPVERGEKWATDFGCVACHSTDGTEMAGPSWQGIFGSEVSLEDGSSVTVDEDYLRRSILMPGDQIVAGYQDIMPKTFEQQFADKEAELADTGVEVDILADLIEYISSVGQ
jgi:cytochrome c oxidase subunit 2